MISIDTANKGVMDQVNVEQQKQSQLVDGMKDLAKTAKMEVRTESSPAVDTVAISDRARQAAADRQPRVAREAANQEQEKTVAPKAAEKSEE